MICVISKAEYGEHKFRNIEMNSSWEENPYGEAYATVPEELIEDILGTKGFCDIELNAEGTAVIGLTPRDIPDMPETASEPSQLDRLEAQVTYTAMMTDTLI